jgi:hypothetical protein
LRGSPSILDRAWITPALVALRRRQPILQVGRRVRAFGGILGQALQDQCVEPARNREPDRAGNTVRRLATSS